MLTSIIYPTVVKPWGKYEVLEKKPKYWIKKLFINQGHSISLQSHNDRVENWLVLYGNIIVTKGTKDYSLTAGDYLTINKGQKHRIRGITNSCILEIAFGLTREKDITRYADDYGRR